MILVTIERSNGELVKKDWKSLDGGSWLGIPPIKYNQEALLAMVRTRGIEYDTTGSGLPSMDLLASFLSFQ